MKLPALFFFWLIIVTQTTQGYLASIQTDMAYTEVYFPIFEALQYPAIFFTLLALFSIGYGLNFLSNQYYRVIATVYVVFSLYHIFIPVLVYWEQDADITIDLIIFFLTDFWIFWLLWGTKTRKEEALNNTVK